jgi:glycosyltransferase involved in cell wall biosynthesis
MKFSIGIPVYKVEFFQECIESILAQTYKNFELIILNDCSPHNIDAVVERFKDTRIRYYKNEQNTGAVNVVLNWNKCLEFAVGEYFVCMGDDDLLASDYLLCFSELINKHSDIEVFHCRTVIIDEYSVPYTVAPLCPEYENIYNYMIACINMERGQFLGDFVYKRKSLLAKGGYYFLPLGWYSDYLTSFVMARDNGIAYTDRILFKYRKSSLNISSTGNIIHKRKAQLGLYKWVDNFYQQNKILTDFEKYERQRLEKGIKTYKEIGEIAFIKQFLGGKKTLLSSLKKIYTIVKRRREFDIKSKHIFKTVIISIIFRD